MIQGSIRNFCVMSADCSKLSLFIVSSWLSPILRRKTYQKSFFACNLWTANFFPFLTPWFWLHSEKSLTSKNPAANFINGHFFKFPYSRPSWLNLRCLQNSLRLPWWTLSVEWFDFTWFYFFQNSALVFRYRSFLWLVQGFKLESLLCQ